MREKGKLAQLEDKLGLKTEEMFSIEERLIRVVVQQQEQIDRLMAHHPKIEK